MIKQNLRIENQQIFDDMIGNFIMTFNNRFVLTYMNGLDREALSPFFVFPDEVNNSADLTLTKLIKHQIMKENIVSIIEEMVKTGVRFYEMNKPQMTIKMTYNIKGMFKAFSLIIRDSVLFEHKNKEDFFSKFEYVVNAALRAGKESQKGIMFRRGASMRTNNSNADFMHHKPTGADRRGAEAAKPPGRFNHGTLKKSRFNKSAGKGLADSVVSSKKSSGFNRYSQEKMSVASKKFIQKSKVDFSQAGFDDKSIKKCDTLGASAVDDDIQNPHKNPENLAKKVERARRRKPVKMSSSHIPNKLHNIAMHKSTIVLKKLNTLEKVDIRELSVVSKVNKNSAVNFHPIQENHQGRGPSLRKATHKLLEDDLCNSIAMEYLPQYIENLARKSSRGEDDIRSRRGSFRNTFFAHQDYHTRKLDRLEKGKYDIQTEEGKQLLEIMNKKKAKAQKKIQHMNKIPELSSIFNHNNISNIDNWNLNTLQLSQLELIVLIRDVFKSMKLFDRYHIKTQIFLDFVWSINYYYTRNNNPFHNFTHGVTVFHACYFFVTKNQKLKELLTEDEQFAFVVSGLGHDLDHRGKNNNFEINTSSDLAIRYHDTSPLEQHHAAILFKILTDYKTNLMNKVDPEKSKDLRHMMIENIKNTDMKVHFDMLAKFRASLENDDLFGSQDRKFEGFLLDFKEILLIFLGFGQIFDFL